MICNLKKPIRDWRVNVHNDAQTLMITRRYIEVAPNRYIEAHGLWEAIETKDNTEVDTKKDKATIAFLYQALTEDVILQVAGCETAKELWDFVKTRHVGEEKVQQARLQSLMIGFNTLQMKDEDTVDAFTAKLNSYATKARELGKTLDESLLFEIMGKLQHFERRIKLRKGGQVESQENLLFVHGEHSGKGRRFNKRGGCKVIMDGNKLTLYDKSKKLLMKVERSKNRLYSIRLQIDTPICLLANVDNQAWLWHARLGHLNFDDINKMTRKGLVKGIPRINHAGTIVMHEQDPINDPNSPITPSTYTYNPQLEEEEEATTSSTKNSGNIFDHVPVRGFKDLAEIYQNTQEVETQTLYYGRKKPRNYKEDQRIRNGFEAYGDLKLRFNQQE
ncbi:zinc finger, CCHC-type containing protein [Tanacetum coccineum]|uniref:Zinc finger, CCHC-type containing protein n=1 Tax=Tanacetum coccineum TaxID=301880 RepID=A0ABQ4YBY4_9ASTR